MSLALALRLVCYVAPMILILLIAHTLKMLAFAAHLFVSYKSMFIEVRAHACFQEPLLKLHWLVFLFILRIEKKKICL